MSDLLDIKLIIEKDWPKLTVYIKNNERNEDVEGIIAAIKAYSDQKDSMVPVLYKDSMVMLPQHRVIRIFVNDRKVLFQTSERIYESKKPLYEVENELDASVFVRISQSEIINIRKVRNFDFSASGTIGVELENGEQTWVARRRVKDVKKVLMGGNNGRA